MYGVCSSADGEGGFRFYSGQYAAQTKIHTHGEDRKKYNVSTIRKYTLKLSTLSYKA